MIVKLTVKESEHFSCNSHQYKYISAADNKSYLFQKQLHKEVSPLP